MTLRLLASLLAVLSISAAAACGGSDASADSTGAGGGGSGGEPGDGGAVDALSPDASDAAEDATSDGNGPDAPPAACGKTLGPGTTSHTITSGGLSRTYLVRIPPGYTGAPTPVVLLFHGWLETPEKIAWRTHFDAAADARGMIAVYPQGTDNSWNAGSCCGSAPGAGIDDVGFVRDLIDQLEIDYCVDPKRVFATGFSNGGMLSNRLGCELSEKIAAIGPVAGPLAMTTCQPTRPVSMIEIHGTSDIVVPYGGGIQGTLPVDENVAAWQARDGCKNAPVTVYQNGDATCTLASDCAAGSAVELCKIEGGGHQWPGGETTYVGKLSTDLDATPTILDFLLAHPM